MDLGMKKKKKKRSLMSEDDCNEKRMKIQDDVNAISSKYGDGIAWVRGCLIGKGCFGSVFLANLKKPKSTYYYYYPPIMAVKSAEVSVSASIQKEKEVLNSLRGCCNVITCFGDEITIGENGQMVYNLLLEYASGGTLADLINKSAPNGLPESDVKRYTRSILRGLRHIHGCGYVHCDLKPENIMLVATSVDHQFTAKIGDLGLAKRAKQNEKGKLIPYCRGTRMYFSPEVVIDGVQEAPSDIWAVGCIVLEMLTANPPCDPRSEANGEVNESPLIVSTLSSEAKSFLKGCFSRKSIFRWTAEMLLAHPFLEGIYDDEDDDDNNVEDTVDVLDINTICSLVMSENEDDDTLISFSSFSDGFCSWSDEEEEEEEETSNTAPLNEVHQYPVTFTIS